MPSCSRECDEWEADHRASGSRRSARAPAFLAPYRGRRTYGTSSRYAALPRKTNHPTSTRLAITPLYFSEADTQARIGWSGVGGRLIARGAAFVSATRSICVEPVRTNRRWTSAMTQKWASSAIHPERWTSHHCSLLHTNLSRTFLTQAVSMPLSATFVKSAVMQGCNRGRRVRRCRGLHAAQTIARYYSMSWLLRCFGCVTGAIASQRQAGNIGTDGAA